MNTLVDQARALAVEMHSAFGHVRSNGEPYWQHPQRVVAVLAACGLPPEVQAAGWLHDVPEDCAADLAECETLLRKIEQRFGPAVARIVGEVTNFFGPEATMEVKQQRLAEHAPHMSPEAKWIKLADRLDNISDMAGWAPEKQGRYAAATLRLMAALRPLPPGSDALGSQIAARAEAVLAHQATPLPG